MLEELEIFEVDTISRESRTREIGFNSGRRVIAHTDNGEETLHITEPNGEVVIKIKLMDCGPVVSVQGANLEIKSTQSLTLESKKVKIKAKEEASLESQGSLSLQSTKTVEVRTEEDVRVKGKMIYLN